MRIRRPSRPGRRHVLGVLLLLAVPPAAPAQTDWDPNAVRFAGPSVWQQAAVAALNRHLPADSGYWVLGPLDRSADLPDTTRLIRTTLRILAPDPRASRTVTRRIWFPTGGVALEELQPSDTLPHELPPGYPGRFVQGTVVGQDVYVQVFTVQEHRWVLWAERTMFAGGEPTSGGPLDQYSEAITRYLAAIDSGKAMPRSPSARLFGLDASFDLFAEPPGRVIGSEEGYQALLARHRGFTLEDAVREVYGFVPAPPLVDWLTEHADPVVFTNKEGEPALQHAYRDFLSAGGRWLEVTLLTSRTVGRLRPGRYDYVVDRYGAVRVAPVSGPGVALDHALLAHNEPVRVAGELVIGTDAGRPGVVEANVRSADYFFSNRSLTIYADVEERSDRYVRALGHLLGALRTAGVPATGILLAKY